MKILWFYVKTIEKISVFFIFQISLYIHIHSRVFGAGAFFEQQMIPRE